MNSREIIKFQSQRFFSHPIYTNYFASKNGEVLSKKRKKILKLYENKKRGGYLYFSLSVNNTQKTFRVSRFVFECFKGVIPEGKEVDHIDNVKKNNNIGNLQLLSHTENTRKSCCKKVISFNIETREEKIFESLKEAAEYYQIHISTVCVNCQKKIKFSKSKKDDMVYKFNYLK